MMRHRVIYEGWSQEDRSTRFFNALHDRCGFWPYNWQSYKNGTETVADFGLPAGKSLPPSLFVDQTEPSDVCWCIPFAIFDASVGITMALNAFCDSTIVFSSVHEFSPARKTRKRGYEGAAMFKGV